PLLVLLLVSYRIPPHVENAGCPVATPDKETPEVEATAVLWNNEVDARGLSIADWGKFVGGQVWIFVFGEGVSDVQWVVDVDIAVGVLVKVVEDVCLKRDRRLHNEGV